MPKPWALTGISQPKLIFRLAGFAHMHTALPPLPKITQMHIVTWCYDYNLLIYKYFRSNHSVWLSRDLRRSFANYSIFSTLLLHSNISAPKGNSLISNVSKTTTHFLIISHPYSLTNHYCRSMRQ